jgi:hypothetical protein
MAAPALSTPATNSHPQRRSLRLCSELQWRKTIVGIIQGMIVAVST